MLSFLHQGDFFHSLQGLVVLHPSTMSRGVRYGAGAVNHPQQEVVQVSALWPASHADDLGAPLTMAQPKN